MEWSHLIAYFFGGVFLANGTPHFIASSMGRPLQTPFANPPGRGLSSSTVNLFWGFSNWVASYFLLCRVGYFDLRSTADIVSVGMGMLGAGLLLARTLGQFHGGCAPRNPDL